MKQLNSQKLTNLEKQIFINDVTLYNAQDNDNHPNIINESNIREKYLDYRTKRQDKIRNSLKNNFCFYLDGLSENDTNYEFIRNEASVLNFCCKGIDHSNLSNFINNENKEVKIPDNSDIIVIVASHGKQDENRNVLISDNLHQKHKPQDIIKKIRETLEHNIQDKDRDISRDINIKFHACYGLLIAQNIDAMQELKKLSKSFPNSRVNLITEKFGSINYGDECLLDKMGNLYPTKVFLNGETHPGIFLTAEEIHQSKKRLFELLERKDKNTIKPGFTMENFISENQTHMHVIMYDPDKAYERYNDDLVNKFSGHLIHLGLSIEDIKHFSNQFQEFSRRQKLTNINSSALDRQKKFINNYSFPAERRTNSFDDEFEKLEAFYQKLKKHEENKKLWSQVFVTKPSISLPPISLPPSTSSPISLPPISPLPSTSSPISLPPISPSPSTSSPISLPPISPPPSTSSPISLNSDTPPSEFKFQASNSGLQAAYIKDRSMSISSPVSKSSFVEKLKKKREERSKSQPSSKGHSL